MHIPSHKFQDRQLMSPKTLHVDPPQMAFSRKYYKNHHNEDLFPRILLVCFLLPLDSSLTTMPLHVLHRAVKLRLQPLCETLFSGRQIDVADSKLLETKLAAPPTDVVLEFAVVCCVCLSLHALRVIECHLLVLRQGDICGVLV